MRAAVAKTTRGTGKGALNIAQMHREALNKRKSFVAQKAEVKIAVKYLGRSPSEIMKLGAVTRKFGAVTNNKAKKIVDRKKSRHEPA